ncbi:MAG: TIGR00282 family metallophosphoesterase [Candidatus Zixiibacteriota bacterium]|nr:MAG: TIGR00282 family metallophosphoesterase [candidate division Zixibacteria bacterium]
MSSLSILFIADICGRPGRQAVAHMLKDLREEHSADLVVANIENAAGGFGVTPEMAQKIFAYGVDIQTSGNHIWDRVQILEYIADTPRLLRPANYPRQAPGSGVHVVEIREHKIAVVNLMGRVYMHTLDCPFKTADRILSRLEGVHTVLVDFHAEATSEKQAMLYHLDGKVSAIIGTHTHVRTADARISSRGTAYVTDAGMTGAHQSIIGMEVGPSLGRFLTGMPKRFSTASEDVKLQGVVVTVDPSDGHATSFESFTHDFDLAAYQGSKADNNSESDTSA